MPATTDILPFATGGGANVESQAAYAADPTTASGFLSGLAPSVKLNKVWRQSAFMAAGLANWMVAQGVSVPDDGNLANLVAEITSSLNAFLAGLPTWTSLAAGYANGWIDYTAPAPLSGFTKTKSGWVRMRGSAKSGTVTPGTTVYQLPASQGLFPYGTQYFSVVSNNLFGALTVDTTGAIKITAGSALGISFDQLEWQGNPAS